ncbi:CDP-glycerol glycerophosphotransferase family protein [Aeromicrobium sp.]|uniref:CDP-glycerol glycerophosphotransferase family protein n=1 Tax=Aeromicrobium sp. TaxID=1871063 RepID=UPI002FC90B59
MGRALGGLATVLNLLSVLTAAIAICYPSSVTARVLVLVLAVLIIGHVALEEVQSRRSGEAPGLLMGKVPLPRAATTLAALAVTVAHDRSWWVVAVTAALLGLIVVEGAVRRPVVNATPQAANVPGWDVVLPSTPVANTYFALTTAAVSLLSVSATFHLTQVPAAVATAATLVAAALVGKQSASYLMARNRFERELPKIMREIAPAFAFHWQAPAGTAYQATMWLPYLDRIGTPYFVLVRTIANFHEVSKMTSAPVILRVGLEDLDPVICPSMKVVFYANTAVRNSHMIRFTHLTHIQLNHGDSDKIASVSPTFRQYDRNFVAGQAAIDRFAKHGVATLPEQFEIVGRPQLEHVHQAAQPIAEISKPTVLYSPTWSGFYEDSDYSSLSAGKQIVQALLARDCTVVFRPHPYGRRHRGNARACDEIIALLEQHARDTGTAHVFGPAAETEMSVVDCFNASDAMISDVSSLASDFLISAKPFAMTAVSAHGDVFLEGFPLARAAYVIDIVKKVAGGLDEALDDMLGPDSHASTRNGLRTYYLSDTPPERITERFLEVSRSYLA